jgi:hypothetical protein
MVRQSMTTSKRSSVSRVSAEPTLPLRPWRRAASISPAGRIEHGAFDGVTSSFRDFARAAADVEQAHTFAVRHPAVEEADQVAGVRDLVGLEILDGGDGAGEGPGQFGGKRRRGRTPSSRPA